jgi:hypothetical protein
VVAVVAVVFGLVTMLAGGRVLFGVSDPGYVVFRPLLVYNSLMGGVYTVVGAGVWRAARWARRGAWMIAALNFVALVATVIGHFLGSSIAIDSVRAMTFRSVVWLVLAFVANAVRGDERP